MEENKAMDSNNLVSLETEIARTYRLPEQLTHELLVNGELRASTDDLVADIADRLRLPVEEVAAAVGQRPVAPAGTGSLATYAAEAALDPTTLEVAISIMWNPSADWKYRTAKVPRATKASLSRVLRETLNDMASDIEDLAGTGKRAQGAEVEVVMPIRVRAPRTR